MRADEITPTITRRTLRAATVAAKLDIGEATLWRWVSAKTFPKPTRLSPGITVWFEHDVDAWLESKAAARITDEVAA